MTQRPTQLPPISIVIPVFNEAGSLDELPERLNKLAARLHPDSEMLLVDDGSTDGSTEALARVADSVPMARVLVHAHNLGYGAALKTGVKQARNEWIGITDADGTYPIEKLPRLLATAVGKKASMVVGARGIADQPAVRRPAKRFLNAFASYLAGVRIPDLNSGLRVYRREDGLRLARFMPQGFSYTSTITMALMGEGARVVYVPIRYFEREGSSKIRPVRDTAGFLLLVCRMAVAFNPLKVFGPVSTALIIAGVLLLALRMTGMEVGLATTVTLLVGGLHMFTVGLLADLINRRSDGL